ncbi:DUF5960 family protein [Facklamia sp. 7083-14-GEN3]|uniref:DUF5960 family protein n=1 Tax=Facklamia sp. 7083-14-GEN3 TaxID=2973478 RepID=UPI0037BEDA25
MEYNFFTPKHLRFESDFTQLCTYGYPIYILIDDMIKAMDSRNENFIEISRKYSADGIPHKFFFTIENGKYEYSHYE